MENTNTNTNTNTPGLYGNDNETFEVRKDGTIWIVQSPDWDDEIETVRLPDDVVRLPDDALYWDPDPEGASLG